MSNIIDDIRDDEIRVIGTLSRRTPTRAEMAPPEEMKTSQEADDSPQKKVRGKGLLWLALLTVLLIIGFVFLPRLGNAPEDPYDGVFEAKMEPLTLPEKTEKKTFGHTADMLSSYTEKIDTVINDVHIAIFIPQNAIPELIVGKPAENDPSIILAAQAADIRADNKQILGAFVNKGTPLSWGLSKKGYCAIIDGEMTIGTSENSPLFEKATETGGYFFRQFPLVDNGRLVENEQKNKSIRKALCSRAGQIFIAVTESDESYHDFSQALVDLSVDNAISLVGSRNAFGWWIDKDGVKTSFADGWHQYKMENYVVWR